METTLCQEKNLTEPEQNCLNNSADAPKDTTEDTKNVSTPPVCENIIAERKIREKLRQKKWRETNKKEIQRKRKLYKARPDIIERNKVNDKKYRKEHIKESRQKLQKYRTTIKGKILNWKNGAKIRNIKWELSKEFLENLPRKCHYTGFDLTLETHHPNSISLDRIDSAKDYTEDNVVFCCSIVNKMKSIFSKEEFIKTCKAIVAHNP